MFQTDFLFWLGGRKWKYQNELKLNDWLDSKGIFNECICGDHSCLFNTGVEVFTPGSATTTIEYLESLKD